VLLCLNSEWQGCESPQLERGARELARELYRDSPHLDLGPATCDSLDTRDGVFALDCVADRFLSTLRELELASPDRVFTVGGTCGAEAAPVAYLSGRYPGIGVVWFDAHGDLNTPATSPSGHFHGMVLRTLLGDGPREFTDHIAGPLDGARVVVAGARDLDPAERDYIESAGVGLVEGWPPDTAARIIDFLRSADVRRLYVHIDVDVFDPEVYRDTLFSVPQGPSLDAAALVVREVVDAFDVVGVGVVESCGNAPEAPQALLGFLIDSGLWPPMM
jgi:arginase